MVKESSLMAMAAFAFFALLTAGLVIEHSRFAILTLILTVFSALAIYERWEGLA